MSALETRRQERAIQGSRRRRDLAAVGLTDHASREAEDRATEALAQREREERLRPQVRPAPVADEAWASARGRLREAVPESTFLLWLEPLACIGEVSDALAVEAPERIFDWVFRRYGALIGHAVRDVSDHRGAFLFRVAAPTPDDDEGLL